MHAKARAREQGSCVLSRLGVLLASSQQYVRSPVQSQATGAHALGCEITDADDGALPAERFPEHLLMADAVLEGKMVREKANMVKLGQAALPEPSAAAEFSSVGVSVAVEEAAVEITQKI